MDQLVALQCPTHAIELRRAAEGGAFVCEQGCEFRVERGVPRFVEPKNYAAGFGLQWNTFRRTQLDSHTGATISADRLRRIAGGDLGIFKGKLVLEAGCGAGRFTEIMLEHGARVFAADLSTAVEANYANCSHSTGYFVCQADITRLPVAAGQFDIVVCIGVIQHTPDPEAAMAALCRCLRPGGLLLIDHYSPGYPATPSRRVLRNFLLKRSSKFALRFCRGLVALLWPMHRVSALLGRLPRLLPARYRFLHWSPVVDYQDAYPQLGAKLLYEWAILDTHDTLTDHFKHLRTAEQIRDHLGSRGMTAIETVYAGNGVEARARHL